jgi:hypothetical protein
MDHNWFCLAKLPGGISCVGPDQLCNITPEGNMVAASLDGVGKTSPGPDRRRIPPCLRVLLHR